MVKRGQTSFKARLNRGLGNDSLELMRQLNDFIKGEKLDDKEFKLKLFESYLDRIYPIEKNKKEEVKTFKPTPIIINAPKDISPRTPIQSPDIEGEVHPHVNGDSGGKDADRSGMDGEQVSEIPRI